MTTIHTERFVKMCASLRHSLVLGCASTVSSRSFTSAICRNLVSQLGGRLSVIFLFIFYIHESNLVNEKCSNESYITIRLSKHLGFPIQNGPKQGEGLKMCGTQ